MRLSGNFLPGISGGEDFVPESPVYAIKNGAVCHPYPTRGRRRSIPLAHVCLIEFPFMAEGDGPTAQTLRFWVRAVQSREGSGTTVF